MIRRFCLIGLFALLSLPLWADNPLLNSQHPQTYVVKKNDTLWDIAGLFLQHPWHWPEIWQVNPQIENPHLIYPGDRLSLVYLDGQPAITLSRGKQTYKMSPEVRELELAKPIPTIDMADIGPFLSKPRVVGAELMDDAPYVVASSDERLISGAGDTVYVRNIQADTGDNFSIFRGGKAYKDPESGEILGYEAIYTGDAVLEQMGDPATVNLIYTNREVQVGDRLLSAETDNYNVNFLPRSPEQAMNGTIISVHDGVSQAGQYQIVVLNLGLRDGLKEGHVLSVFKAGEVVRDDITEDRTDTVQLPDEHAGEALVFRPFDKVSYAIIMRATKAINLDDKVRAAP